MINVHVVAGPTAAGKTAYALELARKNNGVLVNVDSRQVYAHLDIGTNKGSLLPIGSEQLMYCGQTKDFPVFTLAANLPIHLIGFLPLTELLNAFDFRSLVYQVCDLIVKEKKVPILVGGSGLYLSVILQPEKYTGQQTADSESREQLQALSVAQLQARLSGLDKSAFSKLNKSDQNNPRRLIRSIERLMSLPQNLPAEQPPARYTFIKHYIDLPMPELTAKINARVDKMFAEGLVDEVKQILQMGFSPDLPVLQGVGYKQVTLYLQGQISLDECIQQVKVAHRQYAKRQKTWFGKYF